MRKVVVTGGAGFAGRHLVKALLDDGYEVHFFDNLAPLHGRQGSGSWLAALRPAELLELHLRA